VEGIVNVPELETAFAAVSVSVVGGVLGLGAVGVLDTLRLCKDVCLQDLLSPVSWLTPGSVPKNASMKVDSRLIASLAFVELSRDLVDVIGSRICRFFKPSFDSCRAGARDSDPPLTLLSISGADVSFFSSSLAAFV
jgi:hypothetical protein